MVPVRPLAELSSVAWSRLEGCGAPERLPGLVRALANGSTDEREQAWREITLITYHQTDVYECTAEVLPFLLALGASDAHRGDVLDYVWMLASEGGGGRPGDAARVRGLVVEAAEFYVESLASSDAWVRELAAATIGYVPEACAQTAAALTGAIVGERDLGAWITMVWAFGALCAGAEIELFERLMQRRPELAARAVCAAWLVQWMGEGARERDVGTVAEGIHRRAMGAEWHLPGEFLERTLEASPVGGRVYQELRTGRYRGSTE